MNASDEEFSDLPDISINSFGDNTFNVSRSDSLVMPAADELALQRERELVCEQELRALQQARRRSGSADDAAALASAVRELHVEPAIESPPSQALSAAAILEPIMPHLPAECFLHTYYRACQSGRPDLGAVTDKILTGMYTVLDCEEATWSSEEAVSVCVWLCVVCLAAETERSRARAADALRVAVGRGAAHGAAVCAALRRLPRDALVPLGDIAGGALADELPVAVLVDALGLQPPEEGSPLSFAAVADAVAARWATVDAVSRCAVLQAAGRLLARPLPRPPAPSDREERARLLALLERAAPPHPQHPHSIKVLAGAKKLQLLFASKK